jgi:asparagine synthase (glutamine-hydrolysing)
MSGLAGIISINKNRKNKRKINILLDKISHRGSKKESFNICGNYIGINTNYDFNAKADNNIILIDGKIYNLDDLLLKNNIVFESDSISDTQKISVLFKIRGEEIFKEFKGSFVLVIADEKGNIYILRDVIGRKPLYYLRSNQTLMFASEVKSLISFTGDIKELSPGCCMLNLKSPKRVKGINMDDYSVVESPDPEILEKKLEDYLFESIDKRISNKNMSFGVWLSGGLDSSIVAALLKEFSDKIYTYSVGIEGSADLCSAREVASYLGTRHTEYKLNIEELFLSIPKVIYYLESFDAPLVRSSLGNMIASKISASSDVVFSGEGGDELFGGYDYFLQFDSSRVIQQELVKAINSLHNTALQRVDRIANAYSVNIKLPILDESLLDFVLKIHPENKIRKDKNISKYILRKVASNYLPESITWRGKDKFWEGSGISDILDKKIGTMITDDEFIKRRDLIGAFRLRNKEEAYYYEIFRNYYSDININNILSFTKDFD